MSDPAPGWPHEDPDLFREAVTLTAAETGFSAVLVEKDYFCTVLLRHFVDHENALHFKGGTCLAKVHANFYRMSEDLDFTLPIEANAKRAERSRRAATLKAALNLLATRPGWRVVSGFQGSDNSAHYRAAIGYPTLFDAAREVIQLDVSLREPLLSPPIVGRAQSLLIDPRSQTHAPLMPSVDVKCLSFEEAMAEKLRAALSRREPAVRDFFDVDYVSRKRGFRPDAAAIIEMVRTKLAAVRDPVDVSEAKLALLTAEGDTQLKAVVRANDLADFDLPRAFAAVARIAATLSSAS
ncbi:MAG: nucleotidyl transferase AbiEii/AbiGii toxin family protein [Thermoanaerobaculia bacterium]